MLIRGCSLQGSWLAIGDSGAIHFCKGCAQRREATCLTGGEKSTKTKSLAPETAKVGWGSSIARGGGQQARSVQEWKN